MILNLKKARFRISSTITFFHIFKILRNLLQSVLGKSRDPLHSNEKLAITGFETLRMRAIKRDSELFYQLSDYRLLFEHHFLLEPEMYFLEIN